MADTLLERAAVLENRLRHRRESLPDAVDAPSERLRDTIWSEQQMLQSMVGRLTNLQARITQPKPAHNLTPLLVWRDLLLDAQEHFTEQLEAFELFSPSEQRRRYNELYALGRALQVIARGTGSEESESPEVEGWLRAQGVHPEPGERLMFDGRGGLRRVLHRIASIEKRMAGLHVELEAAVLNAEDMVEKPPVHTPVPVA